MNPDDNPTPDNRLDLHAAHLESLADRIRHLQLHEANISLLVQALGRQFDALASDFRSTKLRLALDDLDTHPPDPPAPGAPTLDVSA